MKQNWNLSKCAIGKMWAPDMLLLEKGRCIGSLRQTDHQNSKWIKHREKSPFISNLIASVRAYITRWRGKDGLFLTGCASKTPVNPAKVSQGGSATSDGFLRITITVDMFLWSSLKYNRSVSLKVGLQIHWSDRKKIVLWLLSVLSESSFIF